MKKGMNQGIRRRWMVNSIGMVFFVLLLAVTAFSAFVGNYYYNSIRSAMQTQATAVSDFFSNYATSEQVYLEMANYYVNDFDKQESLELQFINASGQIVLSSYGLTSGGSPDTADITSAIKRQEVSSWSGQNPATGERITGYALRKYLSFVPAGEPLERVTLNVSLPGDQTCQQTITDRKTLMELASLLRNAEPGYIGKCPLGAQLVFALKDGNLQYFAYPVDGCPDFEAENGEAFRLSARDTNRLREIFGQTFDSLE